MDISFVILTWNSEKYIGKCLTSLLTDLKENRFLYEIFIIDNGSIDNTASIINSFKAKYHKHILTIFLNKNRGTTYSRNLALKKARGKYVIIMDSDIEVLRGTIAPLIDTLNKDNKTGLVVPKLLYPNGNLQKSTDVFPTIFTKLFRYFFLKRIEKKDNELKQKLRPKYVDYAISAFWVLKKQVIEKVGLLDENIFYAPEDVDYCLRIWNAGYKILYVPNVAVIHHAQEISRGLKLNFVTINHIKGLIYYFRKHKYIFIPPKRDLFK